MISLIGIGTAGENIVNCFSNNKEYNCYILSDNVSRNSKFKHKIKHCEQLEDYEQNVPNLKSFLLTLMIMCKFFVWIRTHC